MKVREFFEVFCHFSFLSSRKFFCHRWRRDLRCKRCRRLSVGESFPDGKCIPRWEDNWFRWEPSRVRREWCIIRECPDEILLNVRCDLYGGCGKVFGSLQRQWRNKGMSKMCRLSPSSIHRRVPSQKYFSETFHVGFAAACSLLSVALQSHFVAGYLHWNRSLNHLRHLTGDSSFGHYSVDW